MGTRFTSVLYILVQLAIVANIILLYVFYQGSTWALLLALIPYAFIFPKAAGIILKHHDDADKIKAGAKLTVLIHVAFSFLLIVGFLFYLI
jgi:1,4-dihydroxy-2-naphthoate octaprenyltransferase